MTRGSETDHLVILANRKATLSASFRPQGEPPAGRAGISSRLVKKNETVPEHSLCASVRDFSSPSGTGRSVVEMTYGNLSLENYVPSTYRARYSPKAVPALGVISGDEYLKPQ